MSTQGRHLSVPWWLLLVTIAAFVIGILLIIQSGPHVVGYWRHVLPGSGHEKPNSPTTSPSVLDYVGFAASAVSLLGAVSSGTRFLFRLARRRAS